MSGTVLFLGSLALLLIGFFVYGTVVAKIFGIDRNRPTPVQLHQDGVDYVALPRYKIFLIQLLNISGLGPVFGPILGALYGPSALLWVVFGCIFGGAVHDFCAGMMSIRYGGCSYPEIISRNLGRYVRRFMELFTVIFMIMVAAVFVTGPAKLLENISGLPLVVWAVIIFAYYFAAMIMPIDKIIGRVYPYFALLLIFMAVSLITMMFISPDYTILPNTDFFVNTDPSGLPIWPLLFITIACGAISGFHATQSPLMARCIQNEGHAQLLLYGPMITEGIIALIWVTLGLSFYQGPEALQAAIKAGTAAGVVKDICVTMLGSFGGLLALLGVVVLPISTGDTAFRCARLLVADTLSIKQETLVSRILVALPIFSAGIALCFVDFSVIWRYFGWCNQTMACITLWAVSVYLARRGRFHWIASVPAAFMTMVCITYLCYAKIGFGLPQWISTIIGAAVAAAAFFLFLKADKKLPESEAETESVQVKQTEDAQVKQEA